MIFDDWETNFKPTTTHPLEWEDLKGINRKYVWTLVETDNDDVIITGQHAVNHIGFFVTQNPHNYEDWEIIDD